LLHSFYVLGILWICLYDCFILSTKAAQIISVISGIAAELANVFILGIILLPFTLHLLRIAGKKTKIVQLVNLSLFALGAALFVPAMVLSSMRSFSAKTTSPLVSKTVANDVRAIYYLAYFAASAVGAIFILLALLNAVGDHALPPSVKLWTLFTVSALVLGYLIVVIEVFGWNRPGRTMPTSGTITLIVLTNVLTAATFIGVLQTVSGTETRPYDPTDDATFDPDDPTNIAPEEHKPFTYALANGSIEQIPRRYSRYSIPPSNSSPHQSQDWGRSRARLSTIHSIEIASSPVSGDSPVQSRNDALRRLTGSEIRKASIGSQLKLEAISCED
jgi:hypothetical protein